MKKVSVVLKLSNQKKTLIIISLIIVLVLSIAICLTLGSAQLSLGQVVKAVLKRIPLVGERLGYSVSPMDDLIIHSIRLPRILLAILVGCALGAAGVVFQGVFHNPMAEPFVIGVSSGAALGATIAFVLGLNFSFFGLSSVPIMAFLGSMLTTFVVYNIARVGREVPLTVLLLAGVAVGSFMSALNSLLMVFNREESTKIVFWLMGGFSARGWEHVQAAFPYILIGYLVIVFYLEELNLLSLGEEKAQLMGVDVEKVQLILIGAASLIAAAAVSVSGIIGFVGLIVPHIIRILIGPDHKFLLPTATIFGGIFLLWTDTLARTVFSPIEVPVGILTSMAGAPFFVYLLRKNRYK